ncbi:DUF805 domain-containing protein [Chromobacterium haemolyticum]|uniref:DUF805 domain-containing protein n=1 Tax=Chromobacterium haemolyticum TaxID=394935 RepID=UPI004055CF0F
MAMVFCRGCAKEIHETAPSCPHCGALQSGTVAQPAASQDISPIGWFLVVLKKYAVLDGRARRKEYWFFTLFSLLIYIALVVVGTLLGIGEGLALVYNLGVLLPSIAVGVRRLHDTDHSGWWLLLPIVNLIFLVLDTKPGANRFGPSPKPTAV